jgi:tetratricopeptide (TPR) repeat protein
MKKLALTSYFMLLLLSIPAAALANEGPAWIYFVMAPFALLTMPFFLTSVCVAIAAYCYWQYRTSKKMSSGVIAVLMLLVAIPVAVRDKQAYVVAKIQREEREHVRLMAKQRSEARRAGKHVSPNFTAISTAYTAKYQASAKTEADRLNFQASRDMLQMSRSMDAMQQKEPLPVPAADGDDKPPVRSVKTLLFELYAGALLAVTVLAGALIDRWRRRRRKSPLLHLAPLFVCIYAPVFAQLPFMDQLMGMGTERVYLSRLSLQAFSPLVYFAAYLAGILLQSLRSKRLQEPQSEQPPPSEPVPETVNPDTHPSQQAAESFTFFVCPECGLAGKIASDRLPEQGLTATCSRCKTRFPVRRAVSDLTGAIGAASATAAETPETAAAEQPRTKITVSWKKLLAGLGVLLVSYWAGQTMLLNALIVLGSNAGAKFTLLAPQALLPWTLPTQVSFVDTTGNKPLGGKQVRVTWEYHPMGILPETEARYADEVYTTDAQGKIRLPSRLKPPKTYLMAFYHSFNHGIFLNLRDPGFIPVGDRPYLPPRIKGERLAETIAYAPCRTVKDWEHALGSAYLHPYTYLKSAVDGIVAKPGLEAVDDHTLNQLSERCDALVTPASQMVDEEVVRRGPQRIYTETYIRTLIRLGMNDEARAALPLLAGRPNAEEWQEYFRKFTTDLAFESKIKKDAAAFVASGKTAEQLHEEGLTLHKQQKQSQCLTYYQAAISLAPQSSRFHNNYAVAANNLMHDFLAEKLSRKAMAYDPQRGRAYQSLACVMNASGRYLAAYLLSKEALRLGYNDADTWISLAVSADNLKFNKEARSAFSEARNLNPRNPDLQRFRHLEN